MGIWSTLFGSSDNAGKIIDGVKAAADKLVFTDEEKSDMNAKGFELWIKYQEATSGQNVARRLIALLVIGLWVAVSLLCIIAIVLNVSFKADMVQFMQSVISPAAGLVTTFYFVKRFVQK